LFPLFDRKSAFRPDFSARKAVKNGRQTFVLSRKGAFRPDFSARKAVKKRAADLCAFSEKCVSPGFLRP